MPPLTWSTDFGPRTTAIMVQGKPDGPSLHRLGACLDDITSRRACDVRMRIGAGLGSDQALSLVDAVMRSVVAGSSVFVITDNIDSTGHGPSRLRVPGLLDLSRRLLTTPSDPHHTLRRDLLPLVGAGKYSRNVITGACLKWEIPRMAGEACLLASEIVDDSTRRFSGPSTFTALLHDQLLYVAVRRGLSSAPTVSDDIAGLGYAMVHDLATCWGVMRQDDDVITWAALTIGGR